MSNTITFELCAEDRARLDRILDALLVSARSTPDAVTGLPEAKTEAQETKTETQEVKNDVPWENKAEEQPTVTLDDLKALVQELAAPSTGKFEQVKKIVKHFAPKVSQIQESDWLACYEMLTALKEA